MFKTLWDLWLDVDTKLGALHLATSHENDRSERARRARGPPGELGPHARGVQVSKHCNSPRESDNMECIEISKTQDEQSEANKSSRSYVEGELRKI